ncbi:hypothetical protein [Nocardia sp. AG03]|uniref:hypothetical protein n=1 Tax=Nocardia sp. AG03 TaxID=3025312 RepID=UPI0024182315|nr:hypothetical protein [Nocardia sp. AG03]
MTSTRQAERVIGDGFNTFNGFNSGRPSRAARATRTAAVVAFVDRVGETTPAMLATELGVDAKRAADLLAALTAAGRITRTGRGRYVRAARTLDDGADTAAEVIRRGACTPGCLTAAGPSTGCSCPCGGALHGHLAEVPVDLSGGAQ